MKDINVTESFLPPMSEYQENLKLAWDKKWITNRGKLVLELEKKLKDHLDVDNMTLTTNGTLPLQIALRAMGISGEVITTPFSYIASTSSIIWEHCKPVFVDIDPEHLTIDESLIENAITDKTQAILATHVFGNPCAVEVIDKIAKKHKLRVIYDAAHCFGVKYNGKSIFRYGDVSTCSFHATKIFHTGEGGAMVAQDKDLHDKMFYQHNFGHKGPIDFHGLGINAKMSELQAAMGLTVFNHIETVFESRRQVVKKYNELFVNSDIQKLKLRKGTDWNCHYYPVIFKSEEALLKTQVSLNESRIFPRRYFYPSLNTVDYVQGAEMPVSESIAKRILCLPLFVGLSDKDIFRITEIVCSAGK